MHKLPADLKYTKTHNWVESIEENLFRIGITDFAQSELGDIVYAQLPKPGQQYSSGCKCATLESVKSASDIYCPVSGVIVETNKELNENPEPINNDPYSSGWLFIIKSQDQAAVKQLLDANNYAILNGI